MAGAIAEETRGCGQAESVSLEQNYAVRNPLDARPGPFAV